MKQIISILAVAFLSTAFNFSAEAQVMDRLKKKAKEAAERKAEEKVTEQVQLAAERMVEKSWNSIFGVIEDSVSGKKLPFSMNSKVKTEDVYNFNTIVTMEIETIKKEGSSDPPAFMDMHFNDHEMYTGTKFSSEEMNDKDEELFIIFDFKNSAMLMLMDNKEDKFSFTYNWEEDLTDVQNSEAQEVGAEESEPVGAQEYYGYSKIGNKKILGYDCEGYRSETDHQIIEMWMSRNADFGTQNLFKANANTKQMKGKVPENYPRGMIMEMVAEDLQTGEKTTMKVTGIEKNARVKFAMADYPTMSFKSKAGESQ